MLRRQSWIKLQLRSVEDGPFLIIPADQFIHILYARQKSASRSMSLATEVFLALRMSLKAGPATSGIADERLYICQM